MRSVLHRTGLVLGFCMTLGACETLEGAWDDVFSDDEQKTANSAFLNAKEQEAARDWEDIKDSDDPVAVRNFLEAHEGTVYEAVARRRLVQLNTTPAPESPRAYFDGSQEPPVPALPASQPLPAKPTDGQFPAPWLLGTWEVSCGSTAPGNRVIYSFVDATTVRVERDDGTQATYKVSLNDNILTLVGNGLMFRDKVIDVSRIRSYAVRQDNVWHAVDLTYQKCS